MVTSFLIFRCSQPFRPPAPGRNCLSLLVADVNSHSSCVPCQPRKAFTPTKQTNKLTILGSSIYEASAGFQQHLENEIELYWVPQINDTGFQYLQNWKSSELQANSSPLWKWNMGSNSSPLQKRKQEQYKSARVLTSFVTISVEQRCEQHFSDLAMETNRNKSEVT